MVGSIESMVSNIAQENQKILSCDSFRNWSCSLHLKSISIHRHNSVNVSCQPMKSENKEKGPRSTVSPPPTAEPHLPSVEPFPEMKNRPGGPRLQRLYPLIKNSSPTVGPTTPPLHCFTRPNKRNYNPTNVNPSLFFLLNALAWFFGRFKCIRSCPSQPLQICPPPMLKSGALVLYNGVKRKLPRPPFHGALPSKSFD